MQEIVFSPSDFAAALNQTLEYAYPTVTIEGEIANFRVSKNKWVYFDLKDETAQVRFFGSVYLLPGPLEDGLVVRAVGMPRLHPQFGFTVNLRSLLPVGEGSIKKAADLLLKKLEAEGLFAPERKRPLPRAPDKIGLITSEKSAASSDFIKILAERWGGVEVQVADVYVQGAKAPPQIVRAIEHFNQLSDAPEVLVVTRGGGSAEDLAAFNDERVVRAVAASRVPTLIAIGHEVDISLAELAADARASTPSNAAQLIVPDKRSELLALGAAASNLRRYVQTAYSAKTVAVRSWRESVQSKATSLLAAEQDRLAASRRLLTVFDPYSALKRGYSLITKDSTRITTIGQLSVGDSLSVRLHDGTIGANVTKIVKEEAGIG